MGWDYNQAWDYTRLTMVVSKLNIVENNPCHVTFFLANQTT